MKVAVRKLLGHEIIRYGISGVTIAAINYFVYFILQVIGMKYNIANIFGLVISKTAGFFLNKYFVYRAVDSTKKQTAFEAVKFVGARGFTGLVDYFGVILLVEVFSVGSMPAKLITMIAVVILNYILGKLVFRRKHASE